MGFKEKMEKMRQDLLKTTQDSIDRQEDTVEYGSIFIKENIPAGIGFWKPGFGDHLIDIMPFELAGHYPRYPKGTWTYVIDIWVHQNVGAMFDQFVCQVRTHKEPDPMCEYLRANKLPSDQWKVIAPKRRVVYLIWSHDTPEEEAQGLKIWEVAHWNTEKHISEIAKHPKGGAPIPFSDVVMGKQIAFKIVKSGTYTDSQGKERDSMDFVGHRFVERESPIPEKFADKLFSLDACIKFNPTWEEQATAFPLASKPEPTYEPSTEGIRAPALERESGPGDYHTELPETTQEDSPFYDNPPTVLECPGGGIIGVDLEKLDDCKKCLVWDECSDEQDKLKGKSKTKEKPKEEVAVKLFNLESKEEEAPKGMIRRRRRRQ